MVLDHPRRRAREAHEVRARPSRRRGRCGAGAALRRCWRRLRRLARRAAADARRRAGQRSDRDRRDRSLDDRRVPTTGYVEFGPTQALGHAHAGRERPPRWITRATVLGLTADAPATFAPSARRAAPPSPRAASDSIRTGEPARRSAGPDPDRRAATTGSWSCRSSARSPPSSSSTRRARSSGTTPTIGSWTSTARACPSTARACSTTPRRSRASRRRRPSWCACRWTGRSRARSRFRCWRTTSWSTPTARWRRSRSRTGQDADGNRIRGNKLVEVAPDGTQRTVWTSWNCFDYAAAKPATTRSRAGRSRTRSITTPPPTRTTSACGTSAASPR